MLPWPSGSPDLSPMNWTDVYASVTQSLGRFHYCHMHCRKNGLGFHRAWIQKLILSMPRRCRYHKHCRKNGLGFHRAWIQKLILSMPRRCRCHMHCRKNELGFHEPGFRNSFCLCQGDVAVTCTAGRMG